MKTPSRGKAVVLLSGGIDSSVTLAIAISEGLEINALSFDYYQRHRRELESAEMVAESLNVYKHLVVNFDLKAIGGSALTSEIEVPKKAGYKKSEIKSLKEEEKKISNYEIPVTYVPARNTIFLSFALAWAEVLHAENIFIGSNIVDYSGYPDCRPEYLDSFEIMANLATKASIEGKIKFKIRAPLIRMSKAEIIRKGTKMGLDYSLTWSCYDPQFKEVQSSKFKVQGKTKRQKPAKKLAEAIYEPCGLCDSCRLRAKGFEEAGIKDPLLC
jgi:7-cyano-7-deazaguanine synthase